MNQALYLKSIFAKVSGYLKGFQVACRRVLLSLLLVAKTHGCVAQTAAAEPTPRLPESRRHTGTLKLL